MWGPFAGIQLVCRAKLAVLVPYGPLRVQLLELIPRVWRYSRAVVAIRQVRGHMPYDDYRYYC